ncbi:hypothetical protein VSH64_22940 [Amycolatopsis rhabdoformis]|uniref:Uncharacterized protein n=1 Tax=Amycolatopsis rhabdoformis TaxID=1448059 RepID=A0ABZ1INE1_9PSEU|nr:hypothetical protein [Amycolatopsis rhabdoformis]WSE34900.1 hypothetical protein VSH64_22940 [Amycolatopsis rhabdoformis]
MSDELGRLSLLPTRNLVDWWLAGGRLADDTSNWRGLVQLMTLSLLPAPELHRHLRAVDELFDHLARRELMDEHELLERRLMLTLLVANAGLRVPGPAFTPEWAFGVLRAELTPTRLAEAERLAPDWRALPRADIARLRRLKQFIGVARELRAHLDDPDAVAAVASWVRLYPALP